MTPAGVNAVLLTLGCIVIVNGDYGSNPFFQVSETLKQSTSKPNQSNLYVVSPTTGQQFPSNGPSAHIPPVQVPSAQIINQAQAINCANSSVALQIQQVQNSSASAQAQQNWNLNVVNVAQALQTSNAQELNRRCLKSNGLFLGSSCTKFVSCQNGTATELNCPDGLFFNAEGLYCDRPDNVQCNGQTSAAAPLSQTGPSTLLTSQQQYMNQKHQQENKHQHNQQYNNLQHSTNQHHQLQQQTNQQQLNQQTLQHQNSQYLQQLNQQQQQTQQQNYQQLQHEQQQYHQQQKQHYSQQHNQQQQQNHHQFLHQNQQQIEQQHQQQNHHHHHQQQHYGQQTHEQHQHHQQQQYEQHNQRQQEHYQQQQHGQQNQQYQHHQQQQHEQHNQQQHNLQQQHSQQQQQQHHQQHNQQHHEQHQQQHYQHQSQQYYGQQNNQQNQEYLQNQLELLPQGQHQHSSQAANTLIQTNEVLVAPTVAVSSGNPSQKFSGRCLSVKGQFPSDSCHTFYNCWGGVATEQACPDGLLFSTKGYCDYPENVNCAGRRLLNSLPIAASSIESKSPSTTVLPPVSLIPALVTSNPTTVSTPTTATLPAVIDPQLKSKCLSARGQFPSNSCNKFVNCWDDIILEQECPEGFLFSSKGYCDFSHKVDCGSRPVESKGADSAVKSECPLENGTFRNRNKCSSYFTCIANKVVAKYECPEGLNYNDYLGVCDFKNRVDCSMEPLLIPAKSNINMNPIPLLRRGDECPADFATYRDVNNCGIYYTCVSKTIVATYECPAGFNFNDEIGVCDYAEKVDCTKAPKIFQVPQNVLPQVTNDIKQKVENCTPGTMFPLNQQCTSVCLCRDGVAEIVQCPAGLAYDKKTDKCILPHLAKC